MQKAPLISPNPFITYDISSFKIADHQEMEIAWILEDGDLEDWRYMYHCYGTKKILQVVAWSNMISKRNKDFASFFINSDFLHELPGKRRCNQYIKNIAS